MYIDHGSTISLLWLVYSLLATTASIPSPTSILSNSSLESLVSNVHATTSVPFSYRDILFNFSLFGERIPRREIERLLAGADEAITEMVDEHPYFPIANNYFEHRAPGGNTLIAIKAYVGRTIQWEHLSRIFEGLYEFMIGPGAQRDHSQVLEFDIALADQIEIGLGLVWYLPPQTDSSKGRDTKPDSLTSFEERSLQVPNTTGALAAPSTNDDIIVWPIPHTSLTLRFRFLGIPIPDQKLKETLRGAMTKVRRYLNTPYEKDGIDHGVFHWELPPNGDGTVTAITVFAYWGHDVTWRQLFDILSGLLTFATTFSTDLKLHYQVLGFKIYDVGDDEDEGKIGVGSLSYYPRRALAVDKRAEGIGSSRLQLPDVQAAVRYPIPGTADSLTFTSFGQAIPPFKARGAIDSILNDIFACAQTIPQSRVPRNSYKHVNNNGVSITVSASNIHMMTWSQLETIVKGLDFFITGDSPGSPVQHPHYQELTFSIFIEGQDYLGNGFVEYKSPGNAAIERRMTAGKAGKKEKAIISNQILLPANADAPSNSNSTTLPTTIPFPVPDSLITLLLTQFQPQIQTSNFLTLISKALSTIAPYVDEDPDDTIPRKWFEYTTPIDQEGAKISIFVHAYVDHEVTWTIVNDILSGLKQIASATSATHQPSLRFEVDMTGKGEIAMGRVWSDSQSTTITKRTIPLQPINPNTSTHSPANPPIPFPIVNSPLTLTFVDLGTFPIPISTLEAFFPAVLDSINASATTTPHRPITPHLWFYKYQEPRGGAILSISIYTRSTQALSWIQLQKLLKGLEIFMIAQRTTLVFDIDTDGNTAPIAEGLIWYSPSRSEDHTQAKRANIHTPLSLLQPPSSPNTNFSSSIPYPIPSTPLTLHITRTLLPPLIPTTHLAISLTNALHRIAHNVSTQPDTPIWKNSWSFHDVGLGVGMVWIGYGGAGMGEIGDEGLTWRMLGWVLEGLVTWVRQGGSSREREVGGLGVEVDVAMERGRRVRLGSLVVWGGG